MTIYRPELSNLGVTPDLALKLIHRQHMTSDSAEFLAVGRNIIEMEEKIGAGAVTGAGTFTQAMLNALDGVSAYQNFASELNQAALIDPDSVDPHDLTIAQSQATLALNITRNVLSRLVQSWRDLINTR